MQHRIPPPAATGLGDRCARPARDDISGVVSAACRHRHRPGRGRPAERARRERRPLPRDAIQMVASLLASALHADPDYRLPIPTVWSTGTATGWAYRRRHRAWAEREPLSLYVTIPDAGHASNQDNPETFTAELAAFLDRELAQGGRVAASSSVRKVGCSPTVQDGAVAPAIQRRSGGETSDGLIVGAALAALRFCPGRSHANRGIVYAAARSRLLDLRRASCRCQEPCHVMQPVLYSCTRPPSRSRRGRGDGVDGANDRAPGLTGAGRGQSLRVEGVPDRQPRQQ